MRTKNGDAASLIQRIQLCQISLNLFLNYCLHLEHSMSAALGTLSKNYRPATNEEVNFFIYFYFSFLFL